MSAGGVWVAGSDSNSAARLNQKTVTIDTSANLSGMASTYAGQLVFSTDGAAPFNNPVGVLYQRNASNSGWNAITPMTTHDHSTNLATTGGLLSDIFIANTGQLNYQNELMSPRAADFNVTGTNGAGSATDNIASNQWRVNLATTTATNSFAQADFGGIKIDFGSKIKFQSKAEQQTATTGLQGRIGVNIEGAGVAIATPPVKCLGFEFCDATGTTYQLVSSDGTTRSVTNTTQPFNGAHSLKFLYTPSSSIVGTVDQTVATTKTTNLPNSGAADADKNMRFGIMTTNTTAKNLYVYGAVIAGTVNDTWFV